MRGKIPEMCKELHTERNKRMSQFSSALQPSRKSVMVLVTVLALTALAITMPGTLHGQDNAYYSYGLNQQNNRPYAIGGSNGSETQGRPSASIAAIGR